MDSPPYSNVDILIIVFSYCILLFISEIEFCYVFVI